MVGRVQCAQYKGIEDPQLNFITSDRCSSDVLIDKHNTQISARKGLIEINLCLHYINSFKHFKCAQIIKLKLQVSEMNLSSLTKSLTVFCKPNQS